MPRPSPSLEQHTAFASVVDELAALSTLSVAELRAKYLEVFGAPTASRNRDYLRKKLAWRIQELAEGGLSQTAQRRIEDLLADAMTFRFRRPANSDAAPASVLPTALSPEGTAGTASTSGTATEPPIAPVKARDARLPAPGTTLRREYKGAVHEVTVLADGFEFRGQPYRSLSHIARHITGTAWNGFLFFGLAERGANNAGGAR